MKTQTYPTDLADRHWDCIKDLIPAAKVGGRPRSLDMRQVINAIFYILVSGAQWRMLAQGLSELEERLPLLPHLAR